MSKENIAIELSKQRPYFSETSLNLILSISDKIIKAPDNLYRAVNKKDIEAEKVKKTEMNKISDAWKKFLRSGKNKRTVSENRQGQISILSKVILNWDHKGNQQLDS